MSARAQTGYERLTPAQAERVDQLCDRFESVWQQGTAPELEPYLRETADAERLVLLRELILLDALYRRQAGQQPVLADYLERYPELEHDWLHAALSAACPPAALTPKAEPETGVPDIPGFEIVGELGRGGMGVVYKARDTRLNRFVALKFLPTELAREKAYLDRFRREARAAGALNHPSVCTLFGVGEHQGQPFLILEYVEGRTLRTLVGPKPDWPVVLPLVRQAAEALRVAHAAGIVHRDIKPENLMVRPDGYLKLLDFGLARLQSGPGGSAASTHTSVGALIGTVSYMSPEQARGHPASTPSDIFSLGVVLYELATGQRPFDAEGVMATRHAIATRPHRPPRQLNPLVPVPLETLLNRMLAKEPQARPSAAEVERALVALVETR